MRHGGAHHIGYDVHDAVPIPEIIAPGVAVGIGFRPEDNCWLRRMAAKTSLPAFPEHRKKSKLLWRKLHSNIDELKNSTYNLLVNRN